MKRFLFILVVCLCAGCGLFSSNDEEQCESGREGLFIETDRDSYQVGERATLTVENCTGSLIFLDGGSSAQYKLERRVSGAWKRVDGRNGLYHLYLEIKPGEARRVALPVEPEEGQVNVVEGTYRYELDVFDSAKNFLPEEMCRSNAFEIIE